tara:strand:- start:631 stop:1128 length:498 start_codon:yes stop_codon:yes gene_type:complete
MSEEAEIEEGGSSKVFLILGLLLGIAFGGGAGYYFSGGDETAPEQGSSEQKKKVQKDLIAVPFERLAVPIYSVQGNRRRFMGNYFINANVLVDGESNQIAIKRSLAQLQHGFISSISKTDVMKADSQSELDLDKLARVFEQKAVEIMGAGVVESVAITEAILMPR